MDPREELVSELLGKAFGPMQSLQEQAPEGLFDELRLHVGQGKESAVSGERPFSPSAAGQLRGTGVTKACQ